MTGSKTDRDKGGDGIEQARRIMKRLTEMPHRDHADSKIGKAAPAPKRRKPKASKA